MLAFGFPNLSVRIPGCQGYSKKELGFAGGNHYDLPVDRLISEIPMDVYCNARTPIDGDWELIFSNKLFKILPDLRQKACKHLNQLSITAAFDTSQGKDNIFVLIEQCDLPGSRTTVKTCQRLEREAALVNRLNIGEQYRSGCNGHQSKG